MVDNKKNHKVLYVIGILFIIGICIASFSFLFKKGDMKLSANSVAEMENNNWKITIKSSEAKLNESSANPVAIEKSNIKLSGNLQNENSSINYKIKITNEGSIDAYLYNIFNSNSNIDLKLLVNNEELKAGTILKAGKSIDVDLTIKSKVNESTDFENNLKLVFNQYNK